MSTGCPELPEITVVETFEARIHYLPHRAKQLVEDLRLVWPVQEDTLRGVLTFY